MKISYTVVAFYWTKYDREHFEWLDTVVTRIESEAVKVAQGVYILLPEKHKDLIEWATTELRCRERGFACVTTALDSAMPPFQIWPHELSDRDKLDSWDEV